MQLLIMAKSRGLSIIRNLFVMLKELPQDKLFEIKASRYQHRAS